MTLLVDKFNYSHLKRKTIEGKRHYLDSNGQAVPSVTTILSHGKDMTAINNWKKRVGNAEAQRIATESANLGTITHKHLECYIEGTERPVGNNLIYKQAKELSDVIIESKQLHEDKKNINSLLSDIVSWDVDEKLFKLSAANLIDNIKVELKNNKNVEIEFKRNGERYSFLKWGQNSQLDVLSYADQIRNLVKNKFSINLEIEPEIVS